MNNVINVDTETQTISARELREKLNIGTEFAKWFSRMCEYGFSTENDYSEVIVKNDENSKGGRPATDYEISVDMAKQICMIQRTPEGKAVRQYLIDLEKAWNTPEQVFARALKMADQTISKLKGDNAALLEDNERMRPKEVFADAVATSQTSILIGELAKILKQNGISTGEKRLFEWLHNNGYLVSRRGTDYNAPTQKSMELNLFEVKETSISHADGHVTISKTTKVTGKGQQYFINRFLGKEKAEE